MNIKEKVQEKEDQFNNLESQKKELQNNLQEIHSEQLRLQGEYRILQELLQEQND